MKFFTYIRYFFYLGINWSWYIAFTTILQEIKGEKKYGIDTTGADELKKLELNGIDITHATIYMPASYLLLEKIFGHLPASGKNHFLDIGCGKGRALSVAASSGFNKVTGIDFSEDLCKYSTRNLSIIQKKNTQLQFNIINTRAESFRVPEDVDCIFLFNPFDDTVMEMVIKNIMESLQKKPRIIHVAYVNPLYKNLFLRAGFKETFHFKSLKYFEVSVLRFQH